MKRTILALLVSTGAAFGATPKPVAPPAPAPTPVAASYDTVQCAAHLRAVDVSERLIAGIESEALGDDSAVRETNRLMRKSLEQQQQQMRVEMMIAEHCPLPVGEPDNGHLYYFQSSDCAVARVSRDGWREKCSIAKWKPEIAASAPQ